MKSSLVEIKLEQLQKLLRNLGCSCCGWNKASCDIHHIVPRANGGSNDYQNLTYVCPNCHRLAHDGQITKFVTIVEQIGDDWKEFLVERRSQIIAHYQRSAKVNKNISKHNAFRREIRNEKSSQIVEQLRSATIDYAKYGWAKKAAVIVGIAPQKVRSWIQEFAPDLLESSFKRKPLLVQLVVAQSSEG